MATMVKGEAGINIKWMLTISFLFHLLLLFPLLNITNPSKRINIPFSAIHVNIVSEGGVNPSAMPGVDKTGKVGMIQEPVAKGKGEAKHLKAEPPKEQKIVQKIVQKAKTAIPEPKTKEHAVVEQRSIAISQKASPAVPTSIKGEGTDTQNLEALRSTGSNGQAGGVQGARYGTGSSIAGGPAVDIPNFKYDYYLGVIRNKIDSRWSQPVAYNRTRQTLIEFTVHRNGEIDNVRVTESSGDTYFDQTALRAVSLASPLPPLPGGYKEGLLKVRYRFIFGGKG